MEISTRKSYFIEEEEDDRLVSLSEIHPQSYYHYHQYSVSSPRSGFVSGKFHGYRFDNNSYRQPLPHFLDSCFVCKKCLDNRDIFMYRDKPFCREECREEQIEKDEAKEKKQSLSSSVKAMRRNEKRSSSSSSPTRSRDYALHTGTVAAA